MPVERDPLTLNPDTVKTVSEYTELQVPCYALSYLVNGDDSGIEAEDKRNIDDWFEQFEAEAKQVGGHVIFDAGQDEGSFTHSPEFGLACDCVSATVLIVK